MMELIPSISVDEETTEALARRLRREQSAYVDIWQQLDQVKDPEIPALSIWDMGILQDVRVEHDKLSVIITPTYSGCPAIDVIKEDILTALTDVPYSAVDVVTQLSPAWTTHWMSAEAQERMREFGIAPPSDALLCSLPANKSLADAPEEIAAVICPLCESGNTRLVSEFGSTACKSLWQCNDCGEPFDYFKTL